MEEQMKKRACEAIDAAAEDLNSLSQDIWKNPELAYKEHKAHDLLSDYLERQGFQTERKYHIDTAFRATYGDADKPHVSVLCEYDALPEIGHACGHNLIAEVGVAAGLGVKAALQMDGAPQARITVLGTPAEEDIGGKEDLIRAGAFKDLDLSVMAHPGCRNMTSPKCLAIKDIQVTYHGKASHAAAFPWEGVNALDAAVMTYNGVSCLRQQMKPSWRVHGVITDGGAKPNIIPERSQLFYYVRAPTMAEVEILERKFKDICEASAKATGCTVEYEHPSYPYNDLISNTVLAKLYDKHREQLLTDQEKEEEAKHRHTDEKLGSTDMGNVSYQLPAIHPNFKIGDVMTIHSREFCTAAGSAVAQPPTLRTSKALAMSLIEAICQPGVMDRIQQEFRDTEK